MTRQISTRADTGPAVAAAVVVGMCILGAVWLIVSGGWWLLGLIAVIPLGVVCAFGVHDSLAVVPRRETESDERARTAPVHR